MLYILIQYNLILHIYICNIIHIIIQLEHFMHWLVQKAKKAVRSLLGIWASQHASLQAFYIKLAYFTWALLVSISLLEAQSIPRLFFNLSEKFNDVNIQNHYGSQKGQNTLVSPNTRLEFLKLFNIVCDMWNDDIMCF